MSAVPIFTRAFSKEMTSFRYWAFTLIAAAVAAGIAIIAVKGKIAVLPGGSVALDLVDIWSAFMRVPVLNAGVLFGVLAMTAAAAAITSEAQGQTLGLTFSKPVSRAAFLAAKMLAVWASLAISILITGVALIITSFVLKNSLGVGAFPLAVILTMLAALPLAAVMSLIASLMNKQVAVTSLGLVTILVLSPVAGAAGFLILQLDDDFADAGKYPGYDEREEQLTDCFAIGRQHVALTTPQPDTTHAEIDAAYQAGKASLDAFRACDEEKFGHIHEWYRERGAMPMEAPPQASYCYFEATYAAFKTYVQDRAPGQPYTSGSGDSGETSWMAQRAVDLGECRDKYSERPFDIQLEEAYSSKFETIGIAWSRPLNLAANLRAFEAWLDQPIVAGGNSTASLLNDNFGLGALMNEDAGAVDHTPRTGAQATVGVIVVGVLGTVLAAVVISRREVK